MVSSHGRAKSGASVRGQGGSALASLANPGSASEFNSALRAARKRSLNRDAGSGVSIDYRAPSLRIKGFESVDSCASAMHVYCAHLHFVAGPLISAGAALILEC